MKIVTQVNNHLEEIDIANFHEVNEQNTPEQLLANIGLISQIIIMLLEFWKTLPGRKRGARNAKIDIGIMSLRGASAFTKFKQIQ